jgi:glycosyltransferase involved in cell wall biosynthesis
MTGAGLRVLICHNFYQQPGGEDAVFAAERDLLRKHGHHVFEYTDTNDRVDSMNRLALAANTIWSRDAHRKISRLVREVEADIVHVHNTFPLLSPAIYSASREAGAAVVQTLHNFRFMCPNALLFRDGAPCEDCVGRRVALPGVVHGCYRGSRAQSAVTAAMLATHRLRRTLHKDVDAFIALTAYSRQKFIQGGLPASKLLVKPNFIDFVPEPDEDSGEFFLFAGRLAEGKGVDTMLDAWKPGSLPAPLHIAGSGPLLETVKQAAAADSTSIHHLGHLSRQDLWKQMQQARALIFPSNWYENFPVTLVEAFACGLPVIASRLGAMAEIVDDGRTGLLFHPGDPDDLQRKVRWITEHPEERSRMATEARQDYERKYTGNENYSQLVSIYTAARRSLEASPPGKGSE